MKKTILITAGPTREYLDPIRFISNESTGFLGNEIARAACKHGCKVIVISGNKGLRVFPGIKYLYIDSAHDLEIAIRTYIKKTDVLFMTSAVCDFRPAKASSQKIKRPKVGSLSIKLLPTKDILRGLSVRRIRKDRLFFGFCIETRNLLKCAREKLIDKKLDYIVATQYSRKQVPFREGCRQSL